MSQPRLTNQLRHRATLMRLVQSTDDHDRPTTAREPVRTVWYASLGIYSNEKYLSAQAKTSVDKRIAIRRVTDINEHDFGIRVTKKYADGVSVDIDYNITRIYDADNDRLELSLAYVEDNQAVV